MGKRPNRIREFLMIAIFGVGRNGSTLIANYINRITGVFIHPVEERFLSKWHDIVKYGKEKRSTKLNYSNKTVPIDCATVELTGGILFEQYRESFEQVADVLELNRTSVLSFYQKELGSERYTLLEFIEKYLRITAELEGVNISQIKVWGFKTIETMYISHYSAIGFKIINVSRDVLDTCASQKRTLGGVKNLPEYYLGGDWLSTMVFRRIIPQQLTFDDAGKFVCKYERFISEKNKCLAEISEFLGFERLEFVDSQSIREKSYSKNNSSWNVPLPDGLVITRNITASGVELTSGEKKFIQQVLSFDNMNIFEKISLVIGSLDTNQLSVVEIVRLFFTRLYRLI